MKKEDLIDSTNQILDNLSWNSSIPSASAALKINRW